VVGRRAPEKGMTLVELMITMIIASIVAASTFMFFAGQQRVYETQTKMLNVQQTCGPPWRCSAALSAPREQVCRLRAASGGIVASPPPNRSLGVNPDNSDDPPVVSGVRDLSQRPNAGLRAYNAATGQVQRIPPLWIVDQVDPNQPSTAGIVGGPT